MHALKSILFKGVSLGDIIGDILFLSVFTLVTMSMALLLFKRTL